MSYRRIRAAALPATALLSLLALTGCNQMDPLTRPYYWHESEVNRQNIASMAANPRDLFIGQHSDRRRATQESDAVDRVWTGKATPLLSETPGATGGGGGAGSATGSGTGGGAAASGGT